MKLRNLNSVVVGACWMVMVVVPGLATAAQAGAYQLDAGWPSYPPDMHFEMGSGVAVDADGIVYVYTRDVEHWGAHPLAMEDRMGRSTVSMFNSEGEYLGKWGPSEERGFGLGAHTMYIDAQGMFWFVDRDGHTVKKYHPDGSLLLTLGELGEWGDGPDRFNGPTAVVVQANGNLVVADGYWNSRLVWFTAEGKFIKSVGGWGRGPGEFNTVHALAQDARGRLLAVDFCAGALHPYVTAPGQIAEQRNHTAPGCVSRIQIFDGDGNYEDEWTHVSPLSLAVYKEHVYASDEMRNLAVLDAATGKELERYDDLAVYIHQMAMSPAGDIYVASVYPEHAGFKRGIHGPTHRRWTRASPLLR